MTAPILELEWEKIERLEKENAALAAKLEEKEVAAAKMEEEKDSIIAEKDAEIRALREKRRWPYYRRHAR